MSAGTYFKKAFPFSCCYSNGSKTFGRNYILWLTVEELSADQEIAFVEKVQEAIISKFHNRDLSSDVDILKDLPITDANLLQAIYAMLKRFSNFSHNLVSLELDRDSSTKTVYVCR